MKVSLFVVLIQPNPHRAICFALKEVISDLPPLRLSITGFCSSFQVL